MESAKARNLMYIFFSSIILLGNVLKPYLFFLLWSAVTDQYYVGREIIYKKEAGDGCHKLIQENTGLLSSSQ